MKIICIFVSLNHQRYNYAQTQVRHKPVSSRKETIDQAGKIRDDARKNDIARQHSPGCGLQR